MAALSALSTKLDRMAQQVQDFAERRAAFSAAAPIETVAPAEAPEDEIPKDYDCSGTKFAGLPQIDLRTLL